MLKDEIKRIMRDGKPRTSCQICDALYGEQPDGVYWWRVARQCELLAGPGLKWLDVLGKDAMGRTVYKMASDTKEA